MSDPQWRIGDTFWCGALPDEKRPGLFVILPNGGFHKVAVFRNAECVEAFIEALGRMVPIRDDRGDA